MRKVYSESSEKIKHRLRANSGSLAIHGYTLSVSVGTTGPELSATCVR